MGNMALGFPNWVAGTTVATPSIDAAGSWASSMPAANVLDRFLSKKARSTDATTANAKLRIDLGASRNVRLVAIVASNVSTSGQVRVTGYSDSGYSTQVGTTGWVDAWADVYDFGARPWGYPDLFSAKFSAEDAAGYPFGWYYAFDADQIARYWEVEFDDTSNADGYIELGRVVLAPLWVPSLNYIPGASIGWRTSSRVVQSRTGVRFVDSQPEWRFGRYVLDQLPEGEAFASPFDMGRRLALDGEVFVIHDVDDTVHAIRRGYLANLRELPAMEYTDSVDRMGVAIEIEEVSG